MVRHMTQTTVTEITFPENLWRPDRFTALFHMNVYLPKGRLYSLMAVYSTTLKSTFIASKSCKLLLLYLTHCSVSKVDTTFYTPNRLFSLMQKIPYTFIKYICSRHASSAQSLRDKNTKQMYQSNTETYPSDEMWYYGPKPEFSGRISC